MGIGCSWDFQVRGNNFVVFVTGQKTHLMCGQLVLVFMVHREKWVLKLFHVCSIHGVLAPIFDSINKDTRIFKILEH